MNIVLAPDSFKGSLSANEAAEAMALGIHAVNSSIQTSLLPVADGGEGTMESLVRATNGHIVRHQVEDPLGRPVSAGYGILDNRSTCVIEIAEASGLTLLKENEKNPLKASSYGTGQLILHALNAGFRDFIIGLGGSATNDGGAGLLQALGLGLLDAEGQQIPKGGEALRQLKQIDFSHFDQRVKESTFVIASDVDNPFIGPNGASAVFGPQKGASPEMVEQLDNHLSSFADIIQETTSISLHDYKGAGAAGGAGGALLAFFPSTLKPGIDVILEAVAFKKISHQAHLILTGEGKSDFQTLSGKTPLGVSRAAQAANVPVFLISGMVDDKSRPLLQPYFKEIHSVVDQHISVEKAMKEAANLLQLKTTKVIEAFYQQQKTNL